mgnify:FL=1
MVVKRMIRFCTDQSQMEELLKEFHENQVCFLLFRNLTTNLLYKGKIVKYVFYTKCKPKKNEKNIMLWWQ